MAICNISEYFSKFNKDMRSALDSAVNKATGQPLTDMEKDNYIDYRWDAEVRTKMDKESTKAYDYLISSYGGDRRIPYTYGSSRKQGILNLKGVTIDGDSISLHGEKEIYTFENGSIRSNKTSSGRYITAPGLEAIDTQIEFFLGSEDEYMQSDIRDDFEKQELDLINDPKNVKSLMEELDNIDGVTVSSSHKDRLFKVVDMFVDKTEKFIPQMHVYLNKQADKNGGALIFKGRDRGLYVGASARPQVAGNEMSAMEAYAHELIHGATEFARQNNRADVARTVDRIQSLHERAMRVLTPEDLMPKNSPYSEQVERDIAEKMLKYMQSKNGLAEFVAHGLTNERVIEALSKQNVYEKKDLRGLSFFDRLIELVGRLYDHVMQIKRHEHGGIKADELLASLALELANANNKAMVKKRRGLLEKTARGIDRLNMAVSKSIENFEKKVSGKKFVRVKPGASRYAKTIWTLKNAFRLMIDSNTRPFFEAVLSELGMKPERTLQTILRGFRDQDQLQRTLEKIGLASGQIDKARENTAIDIGKMVNLGFKRKMKKKDMTALTLAGLDTDLSSIYSDYSPDEISSFLTNNDSLNAEIQNIRNKFFKKFESDIGTANYYINQANGLGMYMATHQGDITQLLNAENIASKLNTDEVVEYDDETVKLIDALSTLESLRHTSQPAKETLADFISKDELGVKNMMAYHNLFKEQSDKDLFPEDKKINKIKGYTKEVFNSDITIMISPLANRDDMINDGFDLVEVLKKDVSDGSSEQMAVYVNKDHATQSFNRIGMRITDFGRRGTSLKDNRRKSGDPLSDKQAETDVKKVNIRARKDIRQQHVRVIETNPEFSKGSSLVPVFNESGVPIDYRYMMNKEMKMKLLDQDARAPYVLGRMFASIQDKKDTIDFNKSVLDVIEDDMNQNYIPGSKFGKNNKEYIRINPNSSNKEVRDIWNVIPKNIKDEIKKRQIEATGREIDRLGLTPEDIIKIKNGQSVTNSDGKKIDIDDISNVFASEDSIAVRRDLLPSYFGFRDMSIANNAILKHAPRSIKHIVRMSEVIWQEIVKIAKVDIIIRTPAVLVGNITSNFVLSAQLGMNPVDVAKLQLDGVRELKKYNDWSHELNTLRAARDTGNLSGKDLRRIGIIEGYMQDSPVRDLIDAGLFQAIVEDASVEDLRSSSRITRKLDDKLEDAPEFIKTGLHYMYLSEKTLPFKLMTRATQYSDFVARYALFTSLQKKGVKKEDALQKVTDAFINYGAPDSRLVQYLNDIGLVMFTKYFLRIQRVLRTGVSDNPVNFLLAMLGQTFLTGDLDDVTDQSAFTKNYSGIVYNPFDTLMKATIPTSGEFVASIYSSLK